MISYVVAVKDRLTGFKNIFLEENVEVAKRNFKNAFNQPLIVDKSDFELHLLGTFDTETGTFDILKCSELLMTGNEVVINVSNAV